ncbi:MAG: DUF72 domain-containing protein [Gammaproteobacteria bacterium]
MKRDINLGAYGWRHAHWAATFYPEDLPVEEGEDWRLTYYSNEFNSVLVPSSYWQSAQRIDCETWLDDVHDDFRFCIECHANMFEFISLSEFTECLKVLQPQLAALVFLDGKLLEPDSFEMFNLLSDSLALGIYGASEISQQTMAKPVQNIWRPESPQVSNFAFIEDDLSDLRSTRKLVENFVASIVNEDHEPERQSASQSGRQPVPQPGKYDRHASLIVSHPQLQADNLSRFRSVLEIMGH